MVTSTRLARLSDRSLFRAFSTLARDLEGEIEVSHVGETEWSSDTDSEPPEYGNTEFLIERIDLKAGGFKVFFARGVYNPSLVPSNHPDKSLTQRNFLNYRSPSAAFDEAFYTGTLTYPQSKLLEKALKPLRLRVAPKSDEDLLPSLITSQIEQLRELSLDYTDRQKEAEEKLEASFQKRQSDLEARIASEEVRLREEAANHAADLEAERQKLEEWREEINDREPQHERRALRELLSGAISEKLEPDAIKSRWGERMAALSFTTAGAALLVASIYITEGISGNLDGAAWLIAGKSLLAGVAGGAFLWAGLSNLRTATVSAREFEEAALRYRFDIDRASWVVETILQMSANEKTEIPSEWLEAVCRHLFENRTGSDESTSTLEAVSALFDATAKARFGTNGVEFEIDKKGAKKIANSQG